jgi:LacI family transcriptional regulator
VDISHRNPTIKEVAKSASVSTATVSRIINGLPSGYTAETKKHVLTVIDKMGYSPNLNARTMVTRHTGTLGVMLPYLSSMFSPLVLWGIEETAEMNGRNVLISHTEANGRLTMDYLKVMHEKRVDGILFVSSFLLPEYKEFVKRRNIPLVQISTELRGEPIPFVRVNDRPAARDGVRALLELGHRRIAMLAGGDDPVAGIPRTEGYRDALREFGISVREDWVIDVGFDFHDVPRAFDRIKAVLPQVTAFFCVSDEVALGFLNYCQRHGVSVPGQVSILGYDDLPMTTMVVPTLSTIHQPLRLMGQRATQLLLGMLEGGRVPEGEYLAHRVVLRESTASPSQE